MRQKIIAAAGIALIACLQTQAQTDTQVRRIPDSDIQSAVERGIAATWGIRAQSIEVLISTGVVTLIGRTDNLLTREMAAALAANTTGVRAVVNQIEVVPDKRPDAALRYDVVSMIAASPAFSIYEISVAAAEGIVTLRGTVGSWNEKELVVQSTKGVSGVKSIVDHLDVDYSKRGDDNHMRSLIEARLRNDVRIAERLVGVRVVDGRVSLTGSVDSLAQKQRVIASAHVPGVKSVNADALDIIVDRGWRRDRESAKASDEQIREALRDAYRLDPRTMRESFMIEVQNGEVTLTGSLSNLRARESAEETAWHTIAVKRVINHLRVAVKEDAKDIELTGQARVALARNSLLDGYALDVVVINGKATLSGIVATNYEREQAEDVVAEVVGIVEIDNRIEVSKPPVERTDDELREDIMNMFKWNTEIHDGIQVAVNDGTAILTGQADSWYEKRLADQLALSAGAISVRNIIQVR